MRAIPLMLVALPFLAAAPAFALGRRNTKYAYAVTAAVTGVLALLSAVFLLFGQTVEFSFPGVIALGFSLKADGFRALYAAVACLMWFITSLFTPEYMAHGYGQARYAAFTLLTMGATVGVFLSNDLVTTFLFFEILSFTSYTWVIHEETPKAMRTGQTYLAIAILGGMTMLLGLMMLKLRLGTLQFSAMESTVRNVPKESLILPGVLILAGFGAKAGMFPLHVWLPKAHPVAPAPASALLSGILTKVGIFGILVISTRLFLGNERWGNLLLILGLINMALGALLALFSVDLKHTLACSSISQIGFILLGVGMQALLGEHNALAAQGTVLHMLNHSLIKLVLFICAGIVYLKTHSLNLNDIRGFGRGKWGLMLCFGVGAASISGIPLFSGYASKTLLHESLVEYIDHLRHLGHNATWYSIAEWLFILTGGLTFCYMLKLFIAIFIEKHPSRQAEYDAAGRTMKPMTGVALGTAALLLFTPGLRPGGLPTSLANLSLPFLNAHPPEHAVEYLSGVNLLGGAKSLLAGLLLYLFVVRRMLRTRTGHGAGVYLNRWPPWLDLEELLYRPMVQGLTRLGYLLAVPLDLLMERLLLPLAMRILGAAAAFLDGIEKAGAVVSALTTFVARSLETFADGAVVFLMHTIFKRKREKTGVVPVGNRFTYTLGRFADNLAHILRRLTGRRPNGHSYTHLFWAAWSTTHETLRRIQRTLSFSLILFALGLVVLLAFMLAK